MTLPGAAADANGNAAKRRLIAVSQRKIAALNRGIA